MVIYKKGVFCFQTLTRWVLHSFSKSKMGAHHGRVEQVVRGTLSRKRDSRRRRRSICWPYCWTCQAPSLQDAPEVPFVIRDSSSPEKGDRGFRDPIGTPEVVLIPLIGLSKARIFTPSIQQVRLTGLAGFDVLQLCQELCIRLAFIQPYLQLPHDLLLLGQGELPGTPRNRFGGEARAAAFSIRPRPAKDCPLRYAHPAGNGRGAGVLQQRDSLLALGEPLRRSVWSHTMEDTWSGGAMTIFIRRSLTLTRIDDILDSGGSEQASPPPIRGVRRKIRGALSTLKLARYT